MHDEHEMPEIGSQVVDLVVRRFGLGPDAISRESMDHAWAPVERWFLRSDDPAVPRSVVVKTRRTNGSGWGYDPRNIVAEHRALSLLTPSCLAPRVYVASDDVGAIVMEDISPARTVEQVLFGADPAAARDALVRLATAFGAMHSATTPIDPAPWHPDSIIMTPLAEGWANLAQAVRHFHLPDPGACEKEIPVLATDLADPAWWALTHADANPSNVLVAGERTVIIDFEGANPRHIAIDGGAFALSFPAYRYWAELPGDVVPAITNAWRTAIERGFPAVADDAVFFPMLATGSLLWAIMRLTRLPRIADDQQPPDETLRRRTQIVHTVASAVAICERAHAYPALAAWLAELDAALRQRWPESNAPRHLPAFNGGSRAGWIVHHDI